MINEDINYELIEKIVFENPNNYTLGEVIRKIIMEIRETQNGNQET
jgi:hypothetical protein